MYMLRPGLTVTMDVMAQWQYYVDRNNFSPSPHRTLKSDSDKNLFFHENIHIRSSTHDANIVAVQYRSLQGGQAKVNTRARWFDLDLSLTQRKQATKTAACQLSRGSLVSLS
jgi:hypothetical protein